MALGQESELGENDTICYEYYDLKLALAETDSVCSLFLYKTKFTSIPRVVLSFPYLEYLNFGCSNYETISKRKYKKLKKEGVKVYRFNKFEKEECNCIEEIPDWFIELVPKRLPKLELLYFSSKKLKESEVEKLRIVLPNTHIYNDIPIRYTNFVRVID